jgi:acetylornithine deacetylase/succinyl-diaminopimelate desuccinylase-like protein
MLFDLIEESKKLIGIRSVSETGTEEIVSHLLPYVRALGFETMLQKNPEDAREMNLIAHMASQDAKDLCPQGLAFVTHLDTVPGGDPSLWTKTVNDPWNATIVDGKIYGLGSADTKLDILCKLLALERVGLKNIKVPVALIGTFGEERSLAGARLIRDTGIMHPKFALISEPSDLKAVTAHKGMLYFKATFRGGGSSKKGESRSFRGKSAHGSMPHLGENAIEKAIRWLAEQEGMEVTHIQGGTVHNVVPELCVLSVEKSATAPRADFLKKFLSCLEEACAFLKNHTHADFDPPYTTGNFGVLHSQDDGSLYLEFDFRLIPDADQGKIESLFRDLEKKTPGLKVDLFRKNLPLHTLPTTELARRVSEAQIGCGLEVGSFVKSGNTEGPIFQEMGAEAVILGPGHSTGNIHAPNEHNEIAQLHKAVDFYEVFLRKFC